MHIKREHIDTISIEGIRILLLMLWTYTAIYKFGNMGHTLDTMRKQLFPEQVAHLLAYLVPLAAIVCAGLLLYRLWWGLWGSIALLLSFSMYIILFLTEVFREQTCSCAGIFAGLDYQGHLILNIAMLSITIIAVILHKKYLYGDAENREQSRQLNTIYKHHE